MNHAIHPGWLLAALLFSLTVSVNVAHAHEVDPTTLERARREVFPAANSWKTFEREVDSSLASEILDATGRRLQGESLELVFQVAFASDEPGRQGDVLGVMLIREVRTESGRTTIAVGINVRGRIERVVGVDGPDARAVTRITTGIRGSTLSQTLRLEGVTGSSVARDAHAVLWATRALLGGQRAAEPPAAAAPPLFPPPVPVETPLGTPETPPTVSEGATVPSAAAPEGAEPTEPTAVPEPDADVPDRGQEESESERTGDAGDVEAPAAS